MTTDVPAGPSSSVTLNTSGCQASLEIKVDQTIRSYNARLSRVNILTYADLLDSADRSLRFEEHGDYRPKAESDI
jgi:hypothetical protein